MSRAVKDLIMRDVINRVGGTKNMLVLDTSKMEAFATNTMRLKLRQQDIRMVTVKNTLARKALQGQGVVGLEKILKGPSCLVFGGPDIVMLSKELTKLLKEHKKLEIKGGVVDGTAVSAADVDSISKGPTREELIGKIVQLMLSPGANLAAALLGPGGTLAGQVKSIGEEKDEEKEAAPAAP